MTAPITLTVVTVCALSTAGVIAKSTFLFCCLGVFTIRSRPTAYKTTFRCGNLSRNSRMTLLKQFSHLARAKMSDAYLCYIA